MFIYSDDNIAVNTDHIRALYIDRLENPKARMEEDHDKMDVFQLKAALGSRINVILSEARGIENRPKLEARMKEITDRADHRKQYR